MDSITLAVALLVFVLAVAGLRLIRDRSSAPRDFEDEDAILAEIEIYEVYGRLPQAIEVLKEALKSMPDSNKYKSKLNELKSRQRGI